jgi:hypothetical protein
MHQHYHGYFAASLLPYGEALETKIALALDRTRKDSPTPG